VNPMIGRVLQEYEETLSLRDLARRASDPEPTAAAPEPSKALRPSAFVIDDEEGVCTFIAAAVESLGYAATTFTNAQLALGALKHLTPEIIFLDIAIGGSDAIEVLRALEQHGYGGVVQLMSGSNQTILEDVRRIGERHKLIMRPPLQKPFRMDAIRKVIADAPIDVWTAKEPLPDTTPSVGLDQALQRGWLEVWYQPKYDLTKGTFAGAEGLIRCRHPVYGVLSPGSFLPGARPTALAALTEFVVLTALRDWQELSQSGFNLLFAVNASIASLTDLNLPALIRQNRPKNPDWPGLIIEVTEGEVAEDVGLAHEIATQLGIYGISLAIDDFGEGYSSFARLRELPFAELKLDASFVKNCAKDAKNAGICQAIVELAHNFGAVAVAEGLEAMEDVRAIQRMGCDLGQGFAFARPMPSTLFTSVLRNKAK
jgi:EAL domain-containing protein (putative c-di-GMP-specific phosphodiesterase class I)/ActR/RegA family two-component response regulator